MFNLFAKKPPANPNVKDSGGGVYNVRLRTLRHGDIITLRFTKAAHIGVAEAGKGYVLRKGVVSSEHFDRGEIAVHFDDKYRITSTEAEGVEFVPVSEWPQD